MIKKVLPVTLGIAILVVFFGQARALLPGAQRLQSNGTVVSNTGPVGTDHSSGRATGIGLAPAPVANPPASAARLTVTVEALAKAEQGYALEVRVLAPDGKPIDGARVKFYELVDLFGSREMLLGSGTTDGHGVASTSYLPSRAGSHPIVVRFSGRDRVTAGEGRTTFEALVAAERHEAERSRLAGFSDRLPYAAGVMVLAVWGLIAFALFGTARGVIGGARKTSAKGETA